MTIVFTIEPTWTRRRWHWVATTPAGRRIALSAKIYTRPASVRRAIARLCRRAVSGVWTSETVDFWSVRRWRWSIAGGMYSPAMAALGQAAYANAGAAGRAAQAFMAALAAGRYIIDTGWCGRRYGEARG